MATKNRFFINQDKLEKDEFAIKLHSPKDKAKVKVKKYEVSMPAGRTIVINIQLNIPADLVGGDSLPTDGTPFVVFKNSSVTNPGQKTISVEYGVNFQEVVLYVDYLIGLGKKVQHGS